MVTREGLSGPSYFKAANKDLNDDLFDPNFQADIHSIKIHPIRIHLIRIHPADFDDRILSIVN